MLGDCGSLDASSNLAPGPLAPVATLERAPHVLIARAEWVGRRSEAMKKPRGGPNPGERGCDDQAGGESVCSTRGGEASPRVLEPREGLREDGRGAFEGRGLLLRRRAAVHDRIDPPGPGAEQDDEGRGPPLPPDARLPRPRPARVRHAWPPDRGPSREDPGDHEQEGDRGPRDREVRRNVSHVRP